MKKSEVSWEIIYNIKRTYHSCANYLVTATEKHNAEIKNVNRSAENEDWITENRALRSEIAVSERNTKYFPSYLMFREISGFPIGNPSFHAKYKIFTT
jgi:hypothetical protein